MANLVSPHGGVSLRPLMPEGEALSAACERAARLPVVRMSSREAGDVVMLGIGGFTPLAGFMGEADWRGVCDEMRTSDGLYYLPQFIISFKLLEPNSNKLVSLLLGIFD